MGTRVTRVTATTFIAIAAMTACTDDPAPPTEPGTSAVAPANSDVEQRRGDRAEGSISLGDLNKPKAATDINAPFDPCALTWDAFPAAVRPTDGKPHTPTAKQPGPDDPYEIDCRYDNSDPIILDPGGNPTPTSRKVFIASVIWSADKLVADPTKHEGSTAKTWNDRPGIIKPFVDTKHGNACLGLVTLSTGVGGVSVRNSRFPDTDPCTVVDTVLTAITASTS
jgi:hypothetical protein